MTKHSLRKSHGNMYDWVTHTWSPILGCSHQCRYCYVRRNHNLPEVPFLREDDFPDLRSGRVVFVGHLCDMFSEKTDPAHIAQVLAHCRKYGDNEYVFQTKNLEKLIGFVPVFPPKFMIGTTVETNREDLIRELSTAPAPEDRIKAFRSIRSRKFITIEPVLDFDAESFASMIVSSGADFVNIGADSKGHDLKEPPKEKIIEFIERLLSAKVQIRKKVNLARIIGDHVFSTESK